AGAADAIASIALVLPTELEGRNAPAGGSPSTTAPSPDRSGPWWAQRSHGRHLYPGGSSPGISACRRPREPGTGASQENLGFAGAANPRSALRQPRDIVARAFPSSARCPRGERSEPANSTGAH